MLIGFCCLDIMVNDAACLKDKRKVLKSLISRLRNRFNVSIAEAGYQDRWQRAELSIVTVSSQASQVQNVLDKVIRFVENDRRVQVIDVKIELL